MDKRFVVADIAQALNRFAFPTVMQWNRLEGRPRSHQFGRALKAEVRDALWMLTKQWQMGEFTGDDAGAPVLAKLHLETNQLAKYQPAGSSPDQPVTPLAPAQLTPLETNVERQPIPFDWNGQPMRLDLRLQMGRYWLKLIQKKGVGMYRDAYKTALPVTMPVRDRTSAHIYAHPDVWQQYAAVAGRSLDGYQLYQFLTDEDHPTNRASQRVTLINPAHASILDDAGGQFVAWFRQLYQQPNGSADGAWNDAQLEYQFACAAPVGEQERVFSAEEYYHGHLDWYAFDVDRDRQQLGDKPTPDPEVYQQKHTKPLIPRPVEFSGMPTLRWWTFEDAKTNLGDVKPTTADLAKLLLIEFGLIYANDWFMVPFTLPLATLATVRGVAVTNTFGERFWVETAGLGDDEDWRRWSMFTLSVKGNQPAVADTSLLLLNTAPKVQEGEPLERIQFIRDEMANMVWAIESVATVASGSQRQGHELALERRRYHEQLAAEAGTVVPSLPYNAPVSYLSMTTVPENWVPFVPARKDDSTREIQLQRAGMARLIDGDPLPKQKVEPFTTLLRVGADQLPKQAYFIHEEEVSREGTQLTQSFQRTRGYSGEVLVWLGLRKQTGRGEGSSGLAFDQIRNSPKPA